jgi:CheY-like chemotaxis protein
VNPDGILASPFVTSQATLRVFAGASGERGRTRKRTGMTAATLINLRALIVEDNLHMRALLRSLLKVTGIQHIYEASNGEDGFAELEVHRPDFIMTDLNMKPMNGLEFTRRIRTAPNSPSRHIPIIMVTGHTERKYIELARDAGVTEILAKPITARNLYSRLGEIVERPRPFVRCQGYFGPNRRRRALPDYDGPKRRSGEDGVSDQVEI